MLKRTLFVAVVLVLFAQLSFAEDSVITMELMKASYSAGETVQVKITTLPLEKPLKPEQLTLYVEGTKKPIAPFFTRYAENAYLLYFDLPVLVNGQTTLKVEKALYRGTNGLQEITAEKEIPVQRDASSILSIIPAFVVLEKGQTDFQIQIENKRGGVEFNITASPSISHIYKTTQTINFNGKRIFKFSVDPAKLESDAAITIDHEGTIYTVAVLQRQEIVEQQPVQNKTTITTQIKNNLTFVALKSEVNKTITKDTILSGTISLKNEGTQTIEGIVLELTDTLPAVATIDTTIIPSLQPGQSQDILLSINGERESPLGAYSGVLRAKAGDDQITFPIAVTILGKQPDQAINRTTVDLGLQTKEPIDNNQGDLNFSTPLPQPTEHNYPIGLIIITIVCLIALATYFMLKRKKPVQEETFDQYISKIRK